MGCCFSDERDKDSYSETDREREPLLSSQQREHQPNPPSTTDYPDQNVNNRDEQSALTNIINKTSLDIIDVSAGDPQPMDPPNYHEQSRVFHNRLNMVATGVEVAHLFRLPQTAGNTAPQTILSAPPLSLADIQMITSSVERVAKAYKEIKVQHREDLVVPFGVS